jgi:hypothetical protein
MRNNEPPSYLAAVLVLAGEVKPGTVQIATVAHDAGCPRLTGDECTCDAEISLAEIPEAE